MTGAVGLALRGALAGALLWTGACAGVRGQPDWLDGSAASYPKERYLIGVGEAADLDAARDRARAEIARIFEVRIEDAVLDRTEEVTHTQGPHRESSVVERIAIETRSRTQGDLEGVEIVETWEDPLTHRVWALAVLDALRAHRRLLEQAAARGAEAAALSASAQATRGELSAVRARLGALRAGRERDRLLARARVVGSVDAAAARAPATLALAHDLEAALAGIRFAVRARDSGAPEPGDLPGLRDALAARLTRMGFAAADAAGASPGLQVDCRLALRRVERARPAWWHYRWEGACDVADASGVLLSSAEAGSESHPVDATARTKSRARAEQRLAEAVARDLQRYLYGED